MQQMESVVICRLRCRQVAKFYLLGQCENFVFTKEFLADGLCIVAGGRHSDASRAMPPGPICFTLLQLSESA